MLAKTARPPAWLKLTTSQVCQLEAGQRTQQFQELHLGVQLAGLSTEIWEP